MWVAAGARAAAEVLACEACGVRPASEPVPSALRETDAGVLFGALVRQRDDPARLGMRRALACTLARAQPEELDVLARTQLAAELASSADVHALNPPLLAALDELMFSVPVRTFAALLGLPDTSLGRAAALTRSLVCCLGPAATPGTVLRGAAAASELLVLARDKCVPIGPCAGSRAGASPVDELAANAVGLLVQTCEASAGLIGNTLVALARDQVRRVSKAQHPLRDRMSEWAGDAMPVPTDAELGALIERVLRDDPPVQNTRRFAVRDCRVAGNTLRAGDTVLVLLAAAQRDPQVAGTFSFGAGSHECIGAAQARAVARSVVSELLARGLAVSALPAAPSYLPYPNVRIPRICNGAGLRVGEPPRDAFDAAR